MEAASAHGPDEYLRAFPCDALSFSWHLLPAVSSCRALNVSQTAGTAKVFCIVFTFFFLVLSHPLPFLPPCIASFFCTKSRRQHESCQLETTQFSRISVIAKLNNISARARGSQQRVNDIAMANIDDHPPVGWLATCMADFLEVPPTHVTDKVIAAMDALVAANPEIAQAITELLIARDAVFATFGPTFDREKNMEVQNNLAKSFWNLRKILVPKHMSDEDVTVYVHTMIRQG